MDIASVVPMPLQLCTLLGSAGHDSSLWRIEEPSNSERSPSMGDTAIQIKGSYSLPRRSMVAYTPTGRPTPRHSGEDAAAKCPFFRSFEMKSENQMEHISWRESGKKKLFNML
jgi:hypothetical protein